MDVLEAVLCKGVGDSLSQALSRWNLLYTEVHTLTKDNSLTPQHTVHCCSYSFNGDGGMRENPPILYILISTAYGLSPKIIKHGVFCIQQLKFTHEKIKLKSIQQLCLTFNLIYFNIML